ncbi:hypothetical protein E2562_010375 [Oryza meyeriana var. granulata]|uniref:Uncharacterized protein n=1 Tax=Oryza meyeriana var. granulata TaxID=110450 RepID=A0A6G1F6D8_9ORYZ|nr:hypothetical protein E2562_010375 [Oryza meyeriana var. granulata]
MWEQRAGTIIGKLSDDNKDLRKTVDRLEKEWRDLLRTLAAFEEERRLNLILDKERYDEVLEAAKASSSAKRKVIWFLSASLVATTVLVRVTGM